MTRALMIDSSDAADSLVSGRTAVRSSRDSSRPSPNATNASLARYQSTVRARPVVQRLGRLEAERRRENALGSIA